MIGPRFHPGLIACAARTRPGGGRTAVVTLLRLLGAAREVEARLRCVLARRGCTETSFEVLATLRAAKGGCLPPAALATACGLSGGTLTTVLAQLEAAGWIVRRRNPATSRRLLAVLTERGRARHEATIRGYAAALRQIAADADSEAWTELETTLGRLATRTAALA